MKNEMIVEALKLNAEVLSGFIKSIPEEAMMKRRKDFWTIYEHLDHLASAQAMLCGRIENFIQEEKPVVKPYNPADKPVIKKMRTITKLLEDFSKLRAKQVVLLEGCADDVWGKTAQHPQYSEYNFETMVRHILFHDGSHMYRMEELWLLKDEFIKPA